MSKLARARASDILLVLAAAALMVLILFSAGKEKVLFFAAQNRYVAALVISAGVVTFYLCFVRWISFILEARDLAREILQPEKHEDAVFLGADIQGRPVHLRHTYRRMHAQVIGTTNAGKTESVIIPWAVDDIEKNRGLIIIDGKSDRSLLNKMYAYAHRNGRAHDVRILSICSPEISHTFNPLAAGKPLEVVERVFASFEFENAYFKSIQYDVLLHLLLIFDRVKITPSPSRVVEVLKSEAQLLELTAQTADDELISWATSFCRLARDEREQRTSGLIAQLQPFCVGDCAPIFNSLKPDITFEKALEQNLIVYCQLPALKIPTLGKTTGKIILQCLQSAVASRHLGQSQSSKAFSVYLDDFTEYLTPGFVTLLNKSRSANVSIVFAHQALGDLESLGDAVKNSILTNANLKVFMRTNEPTSAEYFASVIGTKQSEKKTERSRSGLLSETKTGDASVREVEEFRFHPNIFKSELGQGEAVIVIPHAQGSMPVRLKFRKRDDLDSVPIPTIIKPPLKNLSCATIQSSIAGASVRSDSKIVAHRLEEYFDHKTSKKEVRV